MAPVELKPCPFCGGPVKLEQTTQWYDSVHGQRQFWGVVCRNTRGPGGTCAIEQRPSASEDAAIARWNNRAPTPAASPEPIDDDTATVMEAFDFGQFSGDMLCGVLAGGAARGIAKSTQQALARYLQRQYDRLYGGKPRPTREPA